MKKTASIYFSSTWIILLLAGCGFSGAGQVPAASNSNSLASTAASRPVAVGAIHKTMAAAAGMTGATVTYISADNTGVGMQVGYPSCPGLAAQVDLWYLNGSTWEFHNRCYIASLLSSANPDTGFCVFKYPVPTGTSMNNVLVRVWQMTSNCGLYADAAGDVTAYDDYLNTKVTSSTVQNAVNYVAYTSNRLVTMETSTYRVKMDRNGGATYEFYSKRAIDTNLASGQTENMIYPNVGAALQFVLASWDPQPGILTTSPCGGQGIWNPTQAGAFCGVDAAGNIYPTNSPAVSNSGLTITCDGVLNNQCSTASQTVTFGNFRMMNWDYGPQYLGSYNAGDTAYMSQTVNAHPDYLSYDVTFQNKGYSRLTDVSLPIMYLNNHYRQYSYPDPSGKTIVSGTVPIDTSGNDSSFASTPSLSLGYMAPWISMQNTLIGIAGNYVTLAAFRDARLQSDQASASTSLFQAAVTHNVIPSINMWLNMQEGVIYGLRYVVFPYRYDETVTTEFGTMTVAQTIAAMRSSYENPGVLTGYVNGVSNGIFSGWACEQGLASSISVDVYAGGPYGTGTYVGRYVASGASGAAVAAACGTDATNYLFTVPVSASLETAYGGQALYVYALPPTASGLAPLLLSNSGKTYVPTASARRTQRL